MINIKELRIGNFVICEDPSTLFVTNKDNESVRNDVDEIMTIDGSRVELFNDGNFNSASYFMPIDIEKINPIPFTLDWALAFGAKINKHNHCILECPNGLVFDLVFEGNVVKGYFGTLNYFNEKLNPLNINQIILIYKENPFVHYFQNLYFSFFCEELVLFYSTEP